MKLRLFIILSAFIVILFSHKAYARPMTIYVYNENGVSMHSLEPLTLFINDKQLINLPLPPVNYLGTVYVPAGEVFKELGAKVEWDGLKREVNISYNGKLITIEINNKTANVNGLLIDMPVPPLIMNDKTMVPLRFIVEEMDFEVGWYPAEWAVKIYGNFEPEVIPVVNNVNQGQVTATATDISNESIKYVQYAETEVISVSIPVASGRQLFAIKTSSPVSGVEKMILGDNRMVIDILNAKMNMVQTSYTVNSSFCTSVRVGQFQNDPVKIARIVFDLKSEINYRVYASEDRMTIYVEFISNSVTDVNFYSDGISDYVTITSTATPNVSILKATNPDRLIIDVLNSTLLMNVLDKKVTGVFSYGLRTGQFDEFTSRVVIDLTAQAAYNISYDANSATIRLGETTHKNIWYDGASKCIVIKKDALGSLNANVLKLTDMYYENKYIITLPGNYTEHIGVGDYSIKDGFIESFSINVTSGKSEITVFENKIFATDITEDAGYIYVKFVNPKEKYDKIVMIDPGHGGYDPGTQGYGMKEKDINLVIAKYLSELFEADGRVKAYITRSSDIYITREARADIANEYADLFISIHNNYFEYNFAVNGTEVHYYPHSNDTLMGITSEKIAEIMSSNITSYLGSYNRKTFKTPLDVLIFTKIPAVLCEIGYLSNEQEAAKLATDSYRKAAAISLYNGIMETFSYYKPLR